MGTGDLFSSWSVDKLLDDVPRRRGVFSENTPRVDHDTYGVVFIFRIRFPYNLLTSGDGYVRRERLARPGNGRVLFRKELASCRAGGA